MSKLIIIRGPSGSGKSTAAREIIGQQKYVSHFEADMFYEVRDGNYAFSLNLLSKAHNWCQLSVEKAMIFGDDIIVVSNTSTRKSEVTPYLDLAETYCYEVDIFRTQDPWDPDILFQRNKHNVPLETIQKQIRRYEPYKYERQFGS